MSTDAGTRYKLTTNPDVTRDTAGNRFSMSVEFGTLYEVRYGAAASIVMITQGDVPRSARTQSSSYRFESRSDIATGYDVQNTDGSENVKTNTDSSTTKGIKCSALSASRDFREPGSLHASVRKRGPERTYTQRNRIPPPRVLEMKKFEK